MVALALMVGWLLLSSVAQAALPGDPGPVALTAEEEAALARGELVVRADATELGARTIAVIDVAAPPRAAIEAALDFSRRVGEVSSLKAIEVYEHAPMLHPEEMKVQWRMSVMGRSVIFHTHYAIERDEGWCAYVLDPDRENDLEYVDGSYRAFSQEGGSRLVYQSVTRTRVEVPTWLRRWLLTGSLQDQMMGIKTRAEQSRGGSEL